MAYSIGNKTAGEIAAFNDDAPIMAAQNAARSANEQAEWRVITGSHLAAGDWPAWSETDVSDATYPTRWAYDDHLHLTTQPEDQDPIVPGYSLLFDLGEAVDIDTIVIANHNFKAIEDEAGVDLRVKVIIANDGDFQFSGGNPSDVLEIASWDTFTTTERLIAFGLGPAHDDDTQDSNFYRYSSVRYLQIAIYDPSTSITAEPLIGEVFIGRGRQISRSPDTPFDDKHTRSTYIDFGSRGPRSRYELMRGQQVMNPQWRPSGADGHGLDDVASFDSLWSDCDYGIRPVWFAPQPSSAPRKTYCGYHAGGDFSRPIQDHTNRVLTFPHEEISPFVSSEG